MRWWWVGAIGLLALGAACAPMQSKAPSTGKAAAGKKTAEATPAMAPAADSPWVEVRRVRVEPVGTGRRVVFELTRAPASVHGTALDDAQVVVDMSGPRPAEAPAVESFPFSDDLVSRVRVGSRDGALRAVLDLARAPGAHSVRAEETNVIVELGDAVTAAAPALTSEPLAATTPADGTAGVGKTPSVAWLGVEDVKMEPAGAGRRLTVRLTRSPDNVKDFTLPDPPRLVIDLQGPQPVAPPKLSRHQVGDSLVSQARVAWKEGTLRVVLDLSGPAGKHDIRQVGDTVIADFGDTTGAPEPIASVPAADATRGVGATPRARALDAAFDEPVVPATAQAAAPTPEPVQTATQDATQGAKPETAPADPAPAPVERTDPPKPSRAEPVDIALADEPPPATMPTTDAPLAEERVHVAPSRRVPRLAEQQQVFRGQRISLDFKDADIQNVLRVLADVSGLNIIATDDVKGKVTLHLTDVPWDQALDLVLRSNRLEKIQEGNVVRISTVARLKEEREALRAAYEAEQELEPLRVKYIRVNYARADEVLVDKVKGVLSDRGSVTFDDRTNTVIVRDISSGINESTSLIRELDVQSPQVLIEANIVEATEDFARALGVQWGYGYKAGPATGNPTGVNFPGTVGLGGSGLGAGSAPPAANPGVVPNPVPFMADFPVPASAGFGPGSGSALDLALGSIDGVHSLTARLTALENEGKGKVISRPRVITMNNVAATIQSLTILRVKLPSTGTVINTGTGGAAGSASTATEKINTGITLVVTPQISSDGFVLMSIYAKSSQPDFTRSVDDIPSEVSREANSNVLIPNGETVVLGGIFRNTSQDNETGVPYLRNVPALGWLFKRLVTNSHREELLVFLTPKVVATGTTSLPTAERLWEGRQHGG